MSRDPARTGSTRLALTFLRIGIMTEAQYRVNFFIQLLQSLLNIAVGLVTLALVFAHTSDLKGWTRPQLLAVMGVFTLVGGLVRTFIQPNMQRVIQDVRDGKLDFVLTKPADAQVLVSVRDVRLWQLTDVLVGSAVLVVAVAQLQGTLGLGDIAAFLGLLVVGMVAIYSFWLLLATASFWLVRMEEVEELFEGLFRAGQYPVGIYPGWLRYGLTFLVPLAFAITVPSEAVTGRLTWAAVLVAGGSAVVLAGLSRWAWTRGLGRYGGASS